MNGQDLQSIIDVIIKNAVVTCVLTYVIKIED